MNTLPDSTHFTPDAWNFEFPCVISMQGSLQIITVAVPFRTLNRFMAASNTGHVLDRSQRELNKARVNRIVSYLMDAHHNSTLFFLPPLIANSDRDIRVELYGNSSVGRAIVPMEAVFDLIDGQHRTNAIIEYARHIIDSSAVNVVLTQNLTLTQRQQFFSDINASASRPAATISLSYNARDQLASELRDLLRDHAVLSKITDFEHNVVPARSPYLVSFKSLYDATARFAGTGDDRMETGEIADIWNAWQALVGVDDVIGISLAVYKQDFIQFYTVMVNAFGLAVNELRREFSPVQIASEVNKLAMNTTMQEREAFFAIERWAGYCVIASEGKVKIKAGVAAQRAASARLAAVIRAGTL